MILSDPNTLLIGLIILGIITLILLCLVIWMFMKMRRFLVGIDAHNISDSLTHVSTNLNELQKFQEEMEGYLDNVENRLKNSVQAVHTVRFNPFHGTGEGGNQSFATAFLTEEGDGAVISSLYSRDRVSVFAKPINKFSSEHEMSDEEKDALAKAKNKLIHHNSKL